MYFCLYDCMIVILNEKDKQYQRVTLTKLTGRWLVVAWLHCFVCPLTQVRIMPWESSYFVVSLALSVHPGTTWCWPCLLFDADKCVQLFWWSVLCCFIHVLCKMRSLAQTSVCVGISQSATATMKRKALVTAKIKLSMVNSDVFVWLCILKIISAFLCAYSIK